MAVSTGLPPWLRDPGRSSPVIAAADMSGSVALT